MENIESGFGRYQNALGGALGVIGEVSPDTREISLRRNEILATVLSLP